MPTPKTAVVVVSHYNAWPTDQLVALLDQIRTVPAGYPFTPLVVVNQAEDKPLDLPPRHADIAVLSRENTGYNIGAWDHGWRHGPRADYYLFLQEECVIARPGWLRAFIRQVRRPGVGLVGEIMGFYNSTWDDVAATVAEYDAPAEVLRYRDYLAERGVAPGVLADHLKSLALCLGRETLAAIDGFRIGISKHEAIACEIGISKSVQAAGLKIRQVGLRPFSFIRHPQWEDDRVAASRPGWMLRRIASDYFLLARWQRLRRERNRRRRGAHPAPIVPASRAPDEKASGDP